MKHLARITPKSVFILLLIVFSSYSAILIARTSYVIDGTRYFTLVDDEMVSMRYGYNLAHGLGFVWNAGERVEGITNPLWALYMAAVHFLPIGIEKTSLIIQITAALFLLATLWYVKKIAEVVIPNAWFVLLACFFTAFYYPLNNWGSVEGTEVAPFTLLLTVATYLAIKTFKTNSSRSFYTLCILLGLAPLLRIDFIPRSLEIMAFLLIISRNRVRMIKGLTIVAILLIAQEAARYWYYGEWLPNTYYLKMTGYPTLLRLTRGAAVTFGEFNSFILLLPYVYLYFKREKILAFLLFIFGAQLLYSAYVGGDAWEFYGGANRYIAPAVPLFFISLTAAMYGLYRYAQTRAMRVFGRYRLVHWVLVALIFLSLNSGNDNTLLQEFLLQPPHATRNLDIAHELPKITKPGAKVGIVLAGATPYFTNRYFIDLLGKNEKTIAREDAHTLTGGRAREQYFAFWPGHMKWDYVYAVNKYHPDIFAEVYPGDQTQYLLTHGYRAVTIHGDVFYVRSGSTQLMLPDIAASTKRNP